MSDATEAPPTPAIEELAALKAAMDAQDFDRARELSTAYVQGHPDEFSEYAGKTIEDVVRMVDVFRAAKLPDSQYRAEAWHFHTWEPQNIGGVAAATLRLH